MSDLISIIVPIYNASEYLDQCIKSILNQTYTELEVVLIDDGSTDSSAGICAKYQKTDKRIQLISQENRGSVAARRTGIDAAKGEYIGFVDADDYIEPDMFEKLYCKIKEHDADFIHSGMISEGKKIYGYSESFVDFSVLDRASYIRDNIFEKPTMFFALWSKLFRADLIKDAFADLPDAQNFGEDLLCLCNYLAKCKTFYMYKEAFYHYRMCESSLSHQNWLDACIEESKLHSYVLRFLAKNNLFEVCGGSARIHYRRRITEAMTEDPSSGISALRYHFADINVLKGKKIALYGAGKVGTDFYMQMARNGRCDIVAWADKEKYGVWNLLPICKPEALQNMKYDLLIIAVKKKEVADAIKAELLQNGVCKDDSQILWKEPICLW